VRLPAGWSAATRRVGRVRLVAVPVLVLLTALIASGFFSRTRLQATWFDDYQMFHPRRIVSMPATIVEIDDKSLKALGQWPWPRTVLAQLIADINAHRPSAIGLDILMPEPDGLSLEHLLARSGNTDPALSRELATRASHDAVLAQAIGAAPTVLAVAGSPTSTGATMRAAPIVVTGVADRLDALALVESNLPHYAGVVTSLDQLDRAATGHGLISVEPAGGVFRRIPLIGNVNGTLVPAFAVEMLRVAQRLPALRLLVTGPSNLEIDAGEYHAITEEDGAVRVYYSPSYSSRFVSAVDILDGNFDPQELTGQLVLVGGTGLGMGENKNTPLGVLMPGVEIHAQLIENLFDRTLLRRPTWAPPVEGLVFLVLGALLVYATPRWSARIAALLALGSVGLMVVSGYLAFRLQRLLFDAASPGVCLILLFGLLLVATLTEATRQRKSLERLILEQRERNARIAGELDAAKRVQLATLPRADLLADDARIDLAAVMIPAREVGGDLYDFFRLDDHQLFFLVGDVAGKGLSASIFMAVSKALYKSTMLRAANADIGDLMTAANTEVSRDNPEMLFVTAFAGVLDLESGDLVYCNAGHENPYLAYATESTVSRIEDGGGPPLCAVDEFDYRGADRRLRPGELLCLISDGVTEARSPGGELYGGERVRTLLQGRAKGGADAAAVVEELRSDLEAFTAGAEAGDDVTVLVLRWNGPQGTGSVTVPG
jgi:adenylate cyclase